MDRLRWNIAATAPYAPLELRVEVLSLTRKGQRIDEGPEITRNAPSAPNEVIQPEENTLAGRERGGWVVNVRIVVWGLCVVRGWSMR